jgi:hypothetical protein
LLIDGTDAMQDGSSEFNITFRGYKPNSKPRGIAAEKAGKIEMTASFEDTDTLDVRLEEAESDSDHLWDGSIDIGSREWALKFGSLETRISQPAHGVTRLIISTGTWKGSIVEGGFIMLTFALVYIVFFRHISI